MRIIDQRKKVLSKLAMFLLIVTAYVFLSMLSASAETQAQNRIDIYSQYGIKPGYSNDGNPNSYLYTGADFLVRDGNICGNGSYVNKYTWSGKQNCLAQAGCNLFAHAHAIEWIKGEHLGDDLLKSLLSRCCNPSDNGSHNYAGCSAHGRSGSSFGAYQDFVHDQGIECDQVWENFDINALREGFNSGYVYIVHVTGSQGGHYVCAVDYVICDGNGYIINDNGIEPIPDGGAFYVQIIDSAPSASTKSGWTFDGKSYDIVNNNQLVYHNGRYGFDYGKCYYVKVSSLEIRTQMRNMNTWKGHDTNPFAIYTSVTKDRNGFYRVISENGETTRAIKQYPYSGSDTIRTLPTNVAISSLTSDDVIEVVEFVANSYEADDPGNHVFAHLSDGTFIYSGFIERLYYKVRDVSSTATYTKTRIRNYPFDESSNLRLVSPPVQLNLVAEYKNRRGNTWYALEGGGFVYAEDLQNIQTLVTLDLQEGSTWEGDKNQRSGYPVGNLNVGEGFGLRGIITASENIASAEARVIVANTDNDALTRVVVYPNSNTLNIQYSDINNMLTFNNLTDGSYVYTVQATTVSGVTKKLIESSFTVGTGVAPADLPTSVIIKCLDTQFYDEVYLYTLEDHAQIPLSGSANPGNYAVAWESSNPSVATAPNPYMEIVGVGTAVIKCYCVDYPEVYAQFTVEVSSSNSAPITDEYEYATFPNGTVYVSQVAYGGYSHANYNVTDVVPDGDVYAPFSGTIRYKDDTWGYVVLESNNMVHYADGSLDYMSVGFMHDNNISDLWVGKSIQKGEAFYQKGVKSPDNNVTGPHVHIVVMRGKLSNYSYYYSRSGNVYLFDAFYLTSGTYIAQSGYDIGLWKYLGSSPTIPSGDKISVSLENASPASGLPKTAGTGVPYSHMPAYQSYGLRGVISAFENIESVTATIFNVTGQYQDASVTINPNSTTANIQYSDINNNIQFNYFNPGAYRYTVIVTTVSGYSETVIDAAFSIGDYDPCSHQYQWETIEQPTCTAPGIQQKICSLCGHPDETVEIDMIAHTPGDWIVIQEPTTTGEGLREHLCSVCGNTIESEAIPLIYTPVTSIDPILGNSTTYHPGSTGTFTAKIYPENATSKEVTWFSSDPSVITVNETGNYIALAVGTSYVYCCATDDSEVMSPAVPVKVEHDLNWVTISEPTATSRGEKQNICIECGFVQETEILPAITSQLMENPDFVTPASLTQIEEQAFAGVPAVLIKLSENVTRIEDLAFDGCVNLRQIYIPRATTTISNTAFGSPARSNITIVSYNNTEAQSYAERNHINFISLDPEPQLSGWTPITDIPDSAEVVHTKTQYSYRDKNISSYTEWSNWSAWSMDQQTITDSNLKQEEIATKHRWWAALCLSCGHNNPYHATNCKLCGSYLGNIDTTWISAFAFSDESSGTETLLGRSNGKYFDGEPYWYMDLGIAYRYRTRNITYNWGAWSVWSETAVDASETREVRTQTLVQYLVK